MTDLEIIRLCALALHGGFNPVRLGNSEAGELVRYECQGEKFDPLHGDAQAMALVNKFRLRVLPQANGHWCADNGEPTPFVKDGYWLGQGDTPNRAICECVAKMQAAKHD